MMVDGIFVEVSNNYITIFQLRNIIEVFQVNQLIRVNPKIPFDMLFYSIYANGKLSGNTVFVQGKRTLISIHCETQDIPGINNLNSVGGDNLHFASEKSFFIHSATVLGMLVQEQLGV